MNQDDRQQAAEYLNSYARHLSMLAEHANYFGETPRGQKLLAESAHARALAEKVTNQC